MKILKQKTASIIILMAVLCLSFFTGGCSTKLRFIPEVSKAVYDLNVLDLTDKNLTRRIIKHKSDLVLMGRNGKIFRWNPEKMITNYLYNINKEISNRVPFHQGDHVLLEIKSASNTSGRSNFVVFDLNQMKEVAGIKSIAARKILGIDKEILVYVTTTNQLIFFNYLTKTVLKRVRLGRMARDSFDKPVEMVYNSNFSNNKIFVITRDLLHIFDRQTAKLSSLALKNKATSGLLVDGRWIYYGSEKRELVKLSITNKVRWHFQMADILRLPPTKVGPYVSIIPEDNNIYFFNKNGTLHWWRKLGSTKLVPPLAMKDNAAVFLWNGEVKFFDYKKKREIRYPLKDWVALKSNLVNFGEYIYFVYGDKEEENRETEADQTPRPFYRQLAKIGNNYGVKITTKPEYIRPKGKSIKVTMKRINLIEPKYHVKIYKLKPDGNLDLSALVLEKTISKPVNPSFYWVPAEVGKYKAIIVIDGTNRKGVHIEEVFDIIDLEKTLWHHYYTVQGQDKEQGWN